ncbi:unnamed protein product, partial [Amoebophrya sp. A25]
EFVADLAICPRSTPKNRRCYLLIQVKGSELPASQWLKAVKHCVKKKRNEYHNTVVVGLTKRKRSALYFTVNKHYRW